MSKVIIYVFLGYRRFVTDASTCTKTFKFITNLAVIARISHKSIERLQIENIYADLTHFLYSVGDQLIYMGKQLLPSRLMYSRIIHKTSLRDEV